MITLFYGVEKAMQDTARILAACAFESAVGLSRKTLVLQFCNERPVENLLIGKQYLIDSAVSKYIGDDSGMASLLRKVRVSGLMDEHFGTYCIQPIPSFQGNAFDIAGVPRVVDFKEEMIEHADAVVKLLDRAKGLYDEVFVLADISELNLFEILLNHVDKKVACILQGYQYPLPGVDKDTIFTCLDFDENSKVGSASVMKSKYGAKKFYPIPYNVDFNDACADNNMLRMLVNNNAGKHEENSSFVAAIRHLMAAILNASEKERISGVSVFDLQEFLSGADKKNLPTEEISVMPQQVSIGERTTGFFKKKKEKEVHAQGAATLDGKKKRKKNIANAGDAEGGF